MEKKKRFRFSLRTLIIIVLLFGLNGALTSTIFLNCVEAWAIHQLDPIPGSRRVDYRFCEQTGIRRIDPQVDMPWHYAVARVEYPFIITLDDGEMIGPCCGQGGRSYYFWALLFPIPIPGVGHGWLS